MSNKYNNVKAFLIARVSDPSQRDALPAQILRLNEYARQKEMDGELYSFDETAYKEDRRKFQEIVEKIAHYPEFCVVVFDKIDRFTRDASSEVVGIFKKLVKDGKLEMHFPSDGLIYHKNSPACDKTRLGMGMVFGEYYSAAISDNVKRRFEQMLEDGIWPGKAPIGYLNITNGKMKDIVVDPSRAQFIKQIFELRANGKTFATIRKMMLEEGLVNNTKKAKPISKSQVEDILKNPFYYGQMRYNGQLYSHKYEPIISKAEFLAAQSINAKQGVTKNKTETKQKYAFQGIAKCAICGCSMSSYVVKGHVYMKCSNAKGTRCGNNVSEANVENEISDYLSGLHFPKQTYDEILKVLCKKHNNKQKFYADRINATKTEIERITKRLDVLYDDRLDGRITVDEYDKKATELKETREEQEQRLSSLTNNDKSFELSASTLLWLAQHAWEIYKSSKPEQKNKILGFLLSNLEIQQKTVLPSLLEPFKCLFEISKSLKTSNWLPGLDSNQ